MDTEYLKSIGLDEKQVGIIIAETDKLKTENRQLDDLKRENERLKNDVKDLGQLKAENSRLRVEANTRSQVATPRVTKSFKTTSDYDKRKAREEIMSVKDRKERQELINNNMDLFR